MSEIYLSSDLHLRHKNIIRYRPQFQTVEEHDAIIRENYLRRVTKYDVVYLLGDVAFSEEGLQEVASWPAKKKILIAGNHCTERVPMRVVCQYFDEVHSMLKLKGFILSHAPIHPDELRGRINIHGHSHYNVIDDERYINVCLEQTNFAPIKLTELMK